MGASEPTEVRVCCRWPLACDAPGPCPGCHLAGTDPGCRTCQARARALQPRQPPRPPRWYEYSYTATGPQYWLRFLLGEPREFVYVVPRRIACRLFGRHNVTCRGRRDHPRRW